MATSTLFRFCSRFKSTKATKYGSPNPEARSACSRASSTVVAPIISRFLLLGCKLGYCWIVEQTAGYLLKLRCGSLLGWNRQVVHCFENPCIVINDKKFFRWFHLYIRGQRSSCATNPRAGAIGERQRPVQYHLSPNTKKDPDQTTLPRLLNLIDALLSETRQLQTLLNNRFGILRSKRAQSLFEIYNN